MKGKSHPEAACFREIKQNVGKTKPGPGCWTGSDTERNKLEEPFKVLTAEVFDFRNSAIYFFLAQLLTASLVRPAGFGESQHSCEVQQGGSEGFTQGAARSSSKQLFSRTYPRVQETGKKPQQPRKDVKVRRIWGPQWMRP